MKLYTDDNNYIEYNNNERFRFSYIVSYIHKHKIQ